MKAESEGDTTNCQNGPARLGPVGLPGFGPSEPGSVLQGAKEFFQSENLMAFFGGVYKPRKKVDAATDWEGFSGSVDGLFGRLV